MEPVRRHSAIARPWSWPQRHGFRGYSSRLTGRFDATAASPRDEDRGKEKGETLHRPSVSKRNAAHCRDDASTLIVLVARVVELSALDPRWPTASSARLSGSASAARPLSCASLTNCEDHRLSWGVSIGPNSGAFGVEEEHRLRPDFFGRTPGFDNAMLTAMSNLMVVIPAGPVHPYGVFGVGLMRPHVELTDLTSLSKTAFGWDFGGGLNIFLTQRLRAEGEHQAPAFVRRKSRSASSGTTTSTSGGQRRGDAAVLTIPVFSRQSSVFSP